MLNRELISFIEDTKIEIEEHGVFQFNNIKNIMFFGDDEYYLVYGTTPDDHPTFLIFYAKGKEVMKSVVVEDPDTEDVLNGYICWEEYLCKNECLLPNHDKNNQKGL